MECHVILENTYTMHLDEEVIAPTTLKMARFLSQQAIDTLKCYVGGRNAIKNMIRTGLEYTLVGILADKMKEAFDNAVDLGEQYRIDATADIDMECKGRDFWKDVTVTITNFCPMRM